MNVSLRANVLLSVQRALLGEITPAMRAISVEWSPTRVLLRVFTQGELSEQAKADFDASAVTQVVADLPFPTGDNPEIVVEFIRCDAPGPVPPLGEFVFLRAED